MKFSFISRSEGPIPRRSERLSSDATEKDERFRTTDLVSQRRIRNVKHRSYALNQAQEIQEVVEQQDG